MYDFSIITACSNQGIHLQETIESVLAQSECSVQHIVAVNKNSQDDSVNIALKYKNDIELIFDEGEGAENAYNKCFGLIKGRYIGLLGAGDTLKKDILRRIKKLFFKQRELKFVCGLAEIFLPGEQTPSFVSPMFTPSLDKILFGGMILRTEACFWDVEIFKKAGMFLNDTSASDYDLWIRLFNSLKSNNVVFKEEIFSSFYLHKKSLDHQIKNLHDMINVRNRHIKQLNIPRDEAIDKIICFTREVYKENKVFAKKYRQPYTFVNDHRIWLSGWPFPEKFASPLEYPDLLKEKLPDLIVYLSNENYKKLVIYGAGKHTKRLLNYLLEEQSTEFKIVGIIDDEPESNIYHLPTTEKVPLIKPEELELKTIKYDCIILSSDIYEDRMYKQLKQLNINEQKIIKIYDRTI